MPEQLSKTINQAMLLCYNFMLTGRFHLALDLSDKLVELYGEQHSCIKLMREDIQVRISSDMQLKTDFDWSKMFGSPWCGEEIGSHQTLQIVVDAVASENVFGLIGLIKQVKDRYKCKIALNVSHAWLDCEIIRKTASIDGVSTCPVEADWVIDVLCLPLMLMGCEWHESYPIDYSKIRASKPLQKNHVHPIPITLETKKKFKVGICLESLQRKSLNINDLKSLENDQIQFYQLGFAKHSINWIEDLKVDIYDVDNLSSVVAALDLVVSVESHVLHLCDIIEVPAIGLLFPNSDEWWDDSNKFFAYNYVTCCRQTSLASDVNLLCQEARDAMLKILEISTSNLSH